MSAFWRILRDGIETICEYPGGRFPYIDGVYSAGTSVATRRGGFLPDLDRFDADFFGISPREAALLDPQQRLLLEVGWEAFEDAGMPVEKIAGSQTGVFVGIWNSDYEHCLYGQPGELDFRATTGGGRYSASGRLAYFLDLRGPNLIVDTACSSSLVAIHLACQSLRQGESEMAIAGGANAILRPEITLTYSSAKMLSPEGRSKFGDSAANGYVRSEGAALIVLKPLARALADGDPIYALIRGSAVNNDGRSSGLLVSPSRIGQEALLRAALRNARVDPGQIDYIEAHGTGTLVGDPVEIETIGRVVDTPARTRPCYLGSVKTNIGHTESAAGVAGVIKVALSLEQGIVPASLHLREPNPAIAWSALPIAVQRTTAPWPNPGPARTGGVSGFGITGTNAHVVLENFAASSPNAVDTTGDRLFLLSGHTEQALRDVAGSWLELLKAEPAWPRSLADLAYTAAVRRTHLDHRLAVAAADREEFEQRLSAWLQQEQAPYVRAGRKCLDRGKAVFVFPGQGGQWHGMARQLVGHAAFREALAACDAAIRKHTGWSVTERLTAPDAEPIVDIDAVQPCLFAVMVSLAALWRSWGIEPGAVVGHSMGEIAAAAVSGALSLDDAAAVVCQRSRLMKSVSQRGLMAVAELSMDEAEGWAHRYAGRISVAASNSPTSTVLSGDAESIDDLIAQLHSREIFCRRIKVEVASHCFHMDPLLEPLVELLRDIRPRAGSIPLYSTASGRIEEGSGLDACYWGRNLRQPVLFSSALQDLLRDGFDAFVEINAHPVLLQAIEEGIETSGKMAVAVCSLRRDQPEFSEMLNALGSLHVAGFPVDFRRVHPDGACLRLPAYSWQRERHWIEIEDEPRARANSGIAVDCSDDLYELQWIEDQPSSTTPKPGGIWILLSNGDAAALKLAAELEAAGDQCLRVADADELGRTLRAFGDLCQGVIRWAGVSSAGGDEAPAEAFDIVRTVRAIASADLTSSPRLWLVSTGVQHLEGDAGGIAAAQSPAWGLGRVIAREHPELRSVNVDLSTAPDETEIRTLCGLIRSGGSEEQIIVRDRNHRVARYHRVEEGKTGEPPKFQSDATYLLTGGLGGIGLNIARWMAELGARHIVLAGRRAPTASASGQIANIESLGAEVRVFSVDAADEAEVSAMLQAIRAEMPPLKGVFHLAGITDGALLADLDAEGLEKVMRPKAQAGWNLDRQVSEDLDFFVLFSSISAAFSQPGLGSYAAANAYVEALARYRRAKGLAAQSIQWGAWHSIGMANDQQVQRGIQSYQTAGFRPLAVDGALKGLGRIMMLNRPGFSVLPASWEQFARSFENAEPPRAFLHLLPTTNQAGSSPSTVESVREKLVAMEASERLPALEAHLQETLAKVLKTSATRIDPARLFGSMGVDSLMAVEFVRRLSATTALSLSATIAFNYPAIHALAREISKRMALTPDDQRAETGASAAGGKETSASSRGPISNEEAIEALIGRRAPVK